MNKTIWKTSLCLVIVSVLTACRPQSSSLADQAISVVGSTSVGPIAHELSDEYTAQNPDISIEIQEIGSSAGINGALDGTAEIGMSSRSLSQEELDKGLIPLEIALDGISIIVHPENPVNTLTSDQVQNIFNGTLQNWSEVGGDNAQIIVITREFGSGTRSTFEELFGLSDENGYSYIEDSYPLTCEGNGSIKANVQSKKYAIGYVSMEIVDEQVKALNIDGVAATMGNVRNKSYPVARSFLFVTLGAPTEKAQDFINFILSEQGQEIVTSNGYISIQP